MVKTRKWAELRSPQLMRGASLLVEATVKAGINYSRLAYRKLLLVEAGDVGGAN